MPLSLVTLVIPAFRESRRLPALLEALVEDSTAADAPVLELLVVDDGSGAEECERERAAVEAAAADLAARGPHRARFVAAPVNRGKGAAIRLGWEEAHPASAWLGFLDADGAVSAREAWRLVRMLPRVEGELDVLAGTRMLMAGRSIRRSLRRHLQGRVFATLVESLLHLGFYDTQCGLKLVRAALLRPLLPRLREERWLLDVEVLALLQRAGARMREEPIDWADPGGSKVVPGLDALRMGAGLRRIRRRLERA
ncbi:MAG TPA: glycosyltransferase [Anaeromyxobacteraceae bacterium]